MATNILVLYMMRQNICLFNYEHNSRLNVFCIEKPINDIRERKKDKMPQPVYKLVYTDKNILKNGVI